MPDEFTALMERLRAEADRGAMEYLDGTDPDAILEPRPFTTLSQLLARELLRLSDANRIDFHDHPQISLVQQVQEAAQSGTMTVRGRTIPAPAGTLITLLALAMRQTVTPRDRQAPMYVLSLMRDRGTSSPHDHGLGIDITRYDSYFFRGPTAEAFEGLLRIVRNLPHGTFELGLPRAPRETPEDHAHYHSFRIEGEPLYRPDESSLEFSPAFRGRVPAASSVPPSQAWAGPTILGPDLEVRRSASRGRGLEADLASMDGLRRERFLRTAGESEGTIRLVFPDEPNHVHITVDIDGAWTNIRPPPRSQRQR